MIGLTTEAVVCFIETLCIHGKHEDALSFLMSKGNTIDDATKIIDEIEERRGG